MTNDFILAFIPKGRENAISQRDLALQLKVSKRRVRQMKSFKTSGCGCAANRCKTFDEFKRKVFKILGLEESEEQLTFF